MVPDFGQPTTKPHDLFQSMFAGVNISNCVFHFSPNPYSAQRHIPNVALFPTGEENPVCRPRKKVRIVESPQYNIFYTLRVLQIKNIKLQKEKNNPKLQNLLIKQ